MIALSRNPKFLISILAFAIIAFAGFSLTSRAGPVTIKQAVTNPPLALFQKDGDVFVLTADLLYRIERTGELITVPAGFVTDFASVPKYAQSFISVLGKHSVPAVVHDFLYWEQTCTRQQADDILAEAMKEYDSPWYQISAVYWAVRAGAGSAWSENTEERKKGLPRVLSKESLPLPANMTWAQYRQKLFDSGEHAIPVPPGTPPPAYCKLPS
jgi:hypothetical protein